MRAGIGSVHVWLMMFVLLCGCPMGKEREQGAEGGHCLAGETCKPGLT